MLLAESPEMPLHNLGVLIFEPAPGTAAHSYDAVRRMFEASVPGVPAFRRRLVQDPLGLGDLRWMEDPHFDLGRHLLRATLPAPAGAAELAAFVASFAEGLLDRDKPLWEIVVVEGLATRELALVAKIHHAAMDGLHLSATLDTLFDRGSDDTRERLALEPWAPEADPGVRRLMIDAARMLAAKPRTLARALAGVAGAVLRSRRGRPMSVRAPRKPKQFAVPPTPWSGALTVHRTVAFCEVSLAHLRAIATAHGVTVNDVVLAASAGSLRRWLLARGALPDSPLVANVPIAVKRAGQAGAGNQISMLRIHLPTQEPCPALRLARIHTETQRGKSHHRASGANPYFRLAELALAATVPALLTRLVHFYSRHRGADFHPALWNVVVSNVPGPQHELYCAGARLTGVYPYGPVQHGSALNLTVMSISDSLCLGVLACPEKVANLGDIALGFSDEVALLRDSAPHAAQFTSR